MATYGYDTTPANVNYSCGTCTQVNGKWNCSNCNFTSASNVPSVNDTVVFATVFKTNRTISTSRDHEGRPLPQHDITFKPGDILILTGVVSAISPDGTSLRFRWLYAQRGNNFLQPLGRNAILVPSEVLTYQYGPSVVYRTALRNTALNQSDEFWGSDSHPNSRRLQENQQWLSMLGFNSETVDNNAVSQIFITPVPGIITLNDWNTLLANKQLVHYPQNNPLQAFGNISNGVQNNNIMNNNVNVPQNNGINNQSLAARLRSMQSNR